MKVRFVCFQKKKTKKQKSPVEGMWLKRIRGLISNQYLTTDKSVYIIRSSATIVLFYTRVQSDIIISPPAFFCFFWFHKTEESTALRAQIHKTGG